MKTLALRMTLVALVLAAAVAAVSGPAGARRGDPDPMASPTDTPFYGLASPPPTVAQASAIDACANDAFLSERTIPAPTQHEVTVCGLVTGTGAAITERGVTRASFMLDVDGTEPIAVAAGNSVTAHPGDVAIVRGRYHRENGGGEGIDETHAVTGRGWSYDGFVTLNGTVSH